MTRSPSFWVVYRQPVHTSWGNSPGFQASGADDRAGVPVRAFVRQTDASVLLDLLEAEARRAVPVGYFMDGYLYGDDPVERLLKAITDAGISPPDLSVAGNAVNAQSGEYGEIVSGAYFAYRNRLQQAVRGWWASVAPTITPDTNAKLWDALFPHLCFYGMHRVLIED